MTKILTTEDNGDLQQLLQESHAVRIPLSINTKDNINKLIIIFRNGGGGAGLAAPQIGIKKRIMLCCYDRNIQNMEIIINPEYRPTKNTLEYGWEGCFSVPNTFGLIARWQSIYVSYYNPDGTKIDKELNDMAARIFQHEYDHLNGDLIINKSKEIKKFDQKTDYINFLKNSYNNA